MFKPIIFQVGAIIAVGVIIGAGDAYVFRPIKVSREVEKIPTPPAPDQPAPTQPATTQPATTQTATTQTSTTQADPSKSSVQPTPATSAPAPVDSTYRPTPQGELPAGHITLDQAKAWHDQQAATFVDSRKRESFIAAHIPGAYRIELHDFSQGDPQILAVIPRDGIVIVYCTGGNCDESEKVAQMLDGSGYKKVYVLHDGIPGWQAMGWPVETGPGIQE